MSGHANLRAMQSQAPNLVSISADLEAAGVRVLVLRGGIGSRDGSSASSAPGHSAGADPTMQLLIPKAHLEAALRVIEPLSWRYSWVHTGLLRLLPMRYYWWDGGPELELYWSVPASPLPPAALRALTCSLWQGAEQMPDGFVRPDPAALLVHLAVQSSRPGRAHEDDWARFLESRTSIDDWARVDDIARTARVSRAVGRARVAAGAGGERPGPGPVYDGAWDIVWRLAMAVQARARPRRLKRLLAGTPWFGDAVIRCRVGELEVLAGPGVFVPSPDADLFVDVASKRVEALERPTIVEVGTGCGAIALALAAARPDAEIQATELSHSAVRWARRNARRLALQRVRFNAGSLLDPLPLGLRGQVDVIIANLPYFPARDYAAIGSVPRGTIQGAGEDGLGLIRQLARDALQYLRPGGGLLLQMFTWQWEVFSAELTQLGYRPGIPRLSGAFAICPADLAAA